MQELNTCENTPIDQWILSTFLLKSHYFSTLFKKNNYKKLAAYTQK